MAQKLLLIFASTLLIFSFTYSATVPDGSELTISFNFKDNNNLLAEGKPTIYVQSDAYKEFIWIEGPYTSNRDCQIIDFERQNIKLTKIITFYESENTGGGHKAITNPWLLTDVDTPNFAAALITAGIFPMCDLGVAQAWLSGCGAFSFAPIDAKRMDNTGSFFCSEDTTQAYVCWINEVGTRRYRGDLTNIPDGVSGTTVYGDSANSNRVNKWNMKDIDGNLIEEGYYLVWVQLAAMRYPLYWDQPGNYLVSGVDQVASEICWDDPYYDTLGHHRVVNLFHFKDSAFTKTDQNEKKWTGDQYDYMDGSMTFEYTVSPVSIGGKNVRLNNANSDLKIFPNPAEKGKVINFEMANPGNIGTNKRVGIYNLKGQLIHSLTLDQTGKGKMKLQRTGSAKFISGVYVAKFKTGGKQYQTKFLIRD